MALVNVKSSQSIEYISGTHAIRTAEHLENSWEVKMKTKLPQDPGDGLGQRGHKVKQNIPIGSQWA